MMSLFLSQVSKEFADYFGILQLDKAAWHRSNCLKVPANIPLIFQPPYSPRHLFGGIIHPKNAAELIPVEHLWEDIREHHCYNQAFSAVEQVKDVLCQGLLELSSNCERLRSMTYFPDLKILPLSAT